ncbi:MerR family DNA-binding protein [Fictibacillus nanhaiensis]|jgi:DNA-binding transcriptional MerR regulator|uniref:MerR family DNA-binding protein n=1 Tax=Fictibacillus nanhaiensis TaxID=742169 RepID=UPI00203BD041|nr:MerR family DNA-binding protein [Fictibacillus nanhaiensis]MCM3733411.1 MerR family DNA-binding protein [Fictibacillus nanhaiensis]
MTKDKLYTISELAAMFDISSRSIRYYEEIGMLISENREIMTKQRSYTNRERRRLKMILRGKKLGFSLQQIKEMIDLYETNPEGDEEKRRIIEFADEKINEINEQILQLQMLKEDIISYKEKYQNHNKNSSTSVKGG